MREKEEMAADDMGSSAAVNEALQYVIYLSLEHVNSVLTIKSLHKKYKIRGRWVMYEL